jgi:hypothetical protein
MAQVSRSTFSTNLATLINDNSVEDVTPAEVRSIFTDLEDSAVWYDEGIVRNATANLTAGYTVTPFSNGTVSSGTFTPAFANGQYQTLTNNGAFTLAAPTGNGSMRLEVTNGASAGAINLSAYTAVTGAFTTTNGHRFRVLIERIGTRNYIDIDPAADN